MRSAYTKMTKSNSLSVEKRCRSQGCTWNTGTSAAQVTAWRSCKQGPGTACQWYSTVWGPVYVFLF